MQRPWSLARRQAFPLEVVQLLHRHHRHDLVGNVGHAEFAQELRATGRIGKRWLALFEQIDNRVLGDPARLRRFDRRLHGDGHSLRIDACRDRRRIAPHSAPIPLHQE